MKVATSTVRYKDGEAALHTDLKRTVRLLVDGWADASDDVLSVVVIQGGITNLLYRVDNATPDARWESALVRVFGAKTELLIDREKDNRVFQTLSDLEFGPHLHGVFDNGRVEGWVKAKPLEPPQMGETSPVNFVALIGQALGRMHTLDVGGERVPMLWDFLAKWFDMSDVSFDHDCKAKGLVALNRAKLREQMGWLQTVLPSAANGHGAAMASGATGADADALRVITSIVFCHNDLLSGNILKLTNADAIQIVDFEYGGFNYAGFDLANHFCEYAGFDFDLDRWYPNLAGQSRFFASYLPVAFPALWATLDTDAKQQALFAALHRRVNQFATASHFFWGFWAIIQARHSPIDFDFMGYALDRFLGYYKHKAAFFPGAFTAGDQAALDTIVAAKAANEAAVKAESDAVKHGGAGASSASGGDAENKGSEDGGDAAAPAPAPAPAAPAPAAKCPFGHGASSSSGSGGSGTAASKPSGKCPYAHKGSEAPKAKGKCPFGYGAKATAGAAAGGEAKRCPHASTAASAGANGSASGGKCPVTRGRVLAGAAVVGLVVVAAIALRKFKASR